MTDHDRPTTGPEPDPPAVGDGPSLDDDIAVGAVLDGEATPEERDRVLAEPRLRARLEELRRVRSLLGEPGEDAVVPSPPSDGADDTAAVATVSGLDPARRTAQRTGSGSGAGPAWIAVAAAVVLLVIGGSLLAARGGGENRTADSSAGPFTGSSTSGPAPEEGVARLPEGSDRARADIPDPVAAAPTGAPTPAADLPVDLGEVADRNRLAERATDLTRGVPAGTPCAGELTARGVTAVATARIGGTAVVVGSGPAGDLVVLEQDSCRPAGG